MSVLILIMILPFTGPAIALERVIGQGPARWRDRVLRGG